jgi:mono/diheme cytochrome c family protein
MIINYKKILVGFLMVATTLSTNLFAQDVAKGEALFKGNCAACHAVTDEIVVGPGLNGIEGRRDFAWITKWVKNPMGVVGSGDKYAVELYNKYNKTQMTAFPNLADADIRNILDYVKSANAVVAPVAGAVTPGATTSPEGQGGGSFFNYALIALMFIMGLVLVALLAILSLLNKLAGGETSTSSEAGTSFIQKLQGGLKEIGTNNTVKSAVIWMFILLGGKASLDGLFKIGVSQGYAPKQPIAFSHKLHAGEYKINCNYCHTGVYKGKQAGIPAANICMNCHNAIKRESPEIQKIYTALKEDQPIEWVRIHNLPDLAYFNHAQHTNVAGLECTNCHGEINKMEVVQQRSSLTMGWCIDCHRKTEVNTKGNAYYDKLLDVHNKTGKGPMKVEDIGGLECSKCHY